MVQKVGYQQMELVAQARLFEIHFARSREKGMLGTLAVKRISRANIIRVSFTHSVRQSAETKTADSAARHFEG